ncbi:hypothetical protein E1176_11530 [Fulvivirga sp. RKSG066]|uniref:thermonuclease family protein n=1 Tax=Fulvivirga aurantia TaxID=2529383 RepID=UPI0012BD4A16|nr:thermonuclease family protein [Fulvivirga aurantia]MTI21652.1 hypothetical protein [Fulvivirga aurantia]
MFKVFLTCILAITAQSYPSNFEGKVVNVIDGNTLEIESKEEGLVKVMLKEVDCPELSQHFGNEAHLFTKKLVYKKKVTVEIKGKDRWGNKLATIKLKNGSQLHEELLKNGMAWASPKEVDLGTIEAQAKSSKTGLWNEDNPTPPWVHRRQQTMLKPKAMY